MELCVGMICGSIPTLTPLLGIARERTSRSRQKNYKKFSGSGEGSHELSSYGSKRPNTDALGIGKPDRAVLVTRPASEERMVQERESDPRAIHATYEVEVNSETREDFHAVGGERSGGGDPKAFRWNLV